MAYRLAAEFLVVVHLSFVAFVVFGGFAVLKWRWIGLVHVPAAAWGALIEFQGWICPLTPWEQSLRRAAGEAGYSGGFVEHYLLPVLYPAGLDRRAQILLGTLVLAINLVVYGWVAYRSRRSRGLTGDPIERA